MLTRTGLTTDCKAGWIYGCIYVSLRRRIYDLINTRINECMVGWGDMDGTMTRLDIRKTEIRLDILRD